MSYDSWLEGMIALDPAPEGGEIARIRAGLAELDRDGRSGRLALSPLGAGFVVEEGFDWEDSLALIEEARGSVLAGYALIGRLTAKGEDDAIVAHVRYEGAGPLVDVVEESVVDDDTTKWIASLEGADDDLKMHIIGLLSTREPELVVGPLAAIAAHDEDSDFRRAALEALGEIGPEAVGALAAIEKGLREADPILRYWATHAAGRLGGGGAPLVEKLEELTKDEAMGPRYGAIDALKRIREG